MAQKPTPEFRAEAVRVALTSGLPRKQMAYDFGIGSVLNFVYLARSMRFQILKRRSARRTLWRTGCGLQTIP